MKTLNVKVLENKKTVTGTLKIKDESFSINTKNNFIKLSYDDIKSYSYDEDEKKLIIQEKDLKVTLFVDYEKELFDKLEKIERKEIDPKNNNVIVDKNNNNTNSNVEQNNEKKSTGVFEIVGTLIFIGIIVVIVINGISGGGSSSKNIKNGYLAKQHALEDIAKDSFYWGTPKSNQLSCEAKERTNDDIVLVLCSTTIEEIKEYYGGASSIWYGYLESADGNKYWHYSSSSKDKVLSELRD